MIYKIKYADECTGRSGEESSGTILSLFYLQEVHQRKEIQKQSSTDGRSNGCLVCSVGDSSNGVVFTDTYY